MTTRVVKVWKAPGVGSNWQIGAAIAKWNRARVSGQPILRRVYTRTSANVTVRMTSGHWWYGWSNGKQSGGQILLDSGTPVWARPRILLHELGHTLGLKHSSSGHRVMHPQAPSMATTPTSLDRRALAARW